MQAARASVSASAPTGLAQVQQCFGCKQLSQQRLACLVRRWQNPGCHIAGESKRQLSAHTQSASRHQKTHLVKRAALCKASGSSVASTEVSKVRASELPGWGAFCDKVSGEWEGYEVTFTSESGSSWAECTAVELPYEVVPDAFREWEIRLFDWQTQCSSYGNKEDGTVFFK